VSLGRSFGASAVLDSGGMGKRCGVTIERRDSAGLGFDRSRTIMSYTLFYQV
jgi:hypothetical protein